MTFTLHLPKPALRLRGLLALLLVTLALLAGVSVSQTQQLQTEATALQAERLPQRKQVQALASAVDELRGLAALHLLLRSDKERLALEGRLQAVRLRIERLMAGFGQRLQDDADRGHHRAVANSLVNFWSWQDQVLAASRRALADAGALSQARALLTGEAQLAFVRLRADIEAWWTHTEQASEQASEQAAEQARSTAQTMAMLQAALVVVAGLALVVLAVLWRSLGQAGGPTAAQRLRALAGAAGTAAGPGVDDRAAQPHLQALNAAVAAARRGEPGRAAGLSAQEARHLAEQVASATQGLKALIERTPPR